VRPKIRPKTCHTWIQNPDAIKPGFADASHEVSDPDLDALVRYLETLR